MGFVKYFSILLFDLRERDRIGFFNFLMIICVIWLFGIWILIFCFLFLKSFGIWLLDFKIKVNGFGKLCFKVLNILLLIWNVYLVIWLMFL